jgi:signal transduction histidine kinase
MSRLALFIRENTGDIMAAWEDFASQLPEAAAMDVTTLRDHARAMLDVIATDIESFQTEPQRARKSQGAAAGRDDSPTAASRHGFGRAESGFRVATMVAEFRALRASVLRLWKERQGQAMATDLEDMTRFNEAIDQAVAESIAEYMRQVDTTRDRFLAVLGHDLRTPLGAILMSSQFLLETAQLTDGQRAMVEGMERSGQRMKGLVKDLLDLAVTRLGDGIPIKRVDMDVGALVHEVVAEMLASNPGSRIEVDTSGSLTGRWDRARLAQAFTNLVGNALQHGSRHAPVTITARGDQAECVVVAVSNLGPPIPADRIGGIFGAMKGSGATRDRRHLGLGLYIVDKIVAAHQGAIAVRSSEGHGTTFTVSLPRHRAVPRSGSVTAPSRPDPRASTGEAARPQRR